PHPVGVRVALLGRREAERGGAEGAAGVAAIRRERRGADGRGTAGGGMERPGRGPDYGVVAGEEESGSEERAAPAAAGVRGLLLGGDGGAEAEALAVGNPLAQERGEAGDGRV